MNDRLIKVAYESSVNKGERISKEMSEFICEDYFGVRTTLENQLQVNLRLGKEIVELREKLAKLSGGDADVCGVPV